MEKLPRLPDVHEPDETQHIPGKRPTFINFYVGFSVVSFGFLLVTSILSFNTLRLAGSGRLSTLPRDVTQAAFIVAFIIVGFIGYFFLRGLWNLRRWARYLAIALQSLSVLSGITTLLNASNRIGSGSFQCGQFFGMALSAYFLYWFVTHGELFS